MKLTHRPAAILGSMLVAIACSLGLASQASAIPTLTLTSPEYLGATPSEPSSEADEASYINVLIDMAINTTAAGPSSPPDYRRSGNTLCFPTCPDATATGAVSGVASDVTGSFGSGYTYLIGKYDGPNFGDAIWYVAGLTGDFELPACAPKIGDPSSCVGLSHYALFNPGPGPGPGPTNEGPGPSQEIPEPSTFILLGSGLLLARGATRRFVRPSK